MSPRQFGMIAGLSICVMFVACDDEVTQETSTTGPTTTTGGGGTGANGGDPTTGGSGGVAQGGTAGEGGDGGTGGTACVPPTPTGNIVTDCGGSVAVTTTTSGSFDCEDCVRDEGAHEYTVSCMGDACECKYDDTVVCTCMKLPSQGCSDSCCPSPWGDTPIGTGGFGGAGGNANGGAGGIGTSNSTGTTSGGGN